MSITVNQLNNNCATLRAFSVAIKDQIDIIDAKIRACEHKFGNNVITHDLPTTFMIHGTDRCTEQKVIYASIIGSLEQRGFKVNILIEEDKSVLVISWKISLPGSELESIHSIIKNARVNRDTFARLSNTNKPAQSSSSTGSSMQHSRGSRGRQSMYYGEWQE